MRRQLREQRRGLAGLQRQPEPYGMAMLYQPGSMRREQATLLAHRSRRAVCGQLGRNVRVCPAATWHMVVEPTPDTNKGRSSWMGARPQRRATLMSETRI